MLLMTEKRTDERLGDLNGRVSEGFARVDGDIREVRGEIREVRGEIRELRGEVNSRFDVVDARFDALHKLLIRAAGGAIAVLVTTGVALVATQL